MSIIVLPTNIGDPWEAMVRSDYLSGKIDVDQFEEEIALVLSGGLPQRVLPGLSPFDRPAIEAVVR